jgi:hypothetical protein
MALGVKDHLFTDSKAAVPLDVRIVAMRSFVSTVSNATPNLTRVGDNDRRQLERPIG